MARAQYNTLVLPYHLSSNGSEYAVFHCTHGSMIQFLAGGGEDDETPFEAARREAREEAGIEVPPDHWIKLDSQASIPRDAFPHAPWPENVHVVTEHAFAVRLVTKDLVLSPEHNQYEWLNYEQARQALTWDSNRVALFELNRRLLRMNDKAHPNSLI
jgi:dATP pyrophosphohydrolase